MFELHVIVAGIIMFNILELIIEIVPNFPTRTKVCTDSKFVFDQKLRHNIYCMKIMDLY
jgi:hypothetical protein